MLFSFFPKPTKVIQITSPQTNYDLRVQSGSPTYPLNIICIINATISGTTSTSPAFRTGTGWSAGSWIFIKNQNSILGFTASNINYGVPGTGGAGGNGASNTADATAGSIGGPGLSGLIGPSGGPALLADSVTNVTIIFDNQNGSIIGGPGGHSNGGPGGGGGGGGGGATG